MRRSNHPRKSGRTELLSDRRGSADVVPFRSLFREPQTPSTRPRQGIPSPPGKCSRLGPGTAGARGLHPRSRRQTGAVRSGGVLDRDRHRDVARDVVGRDRDLFRVSGRRPYPADRTPGGDAVCLRGPHRRTARQGRSYHQPAVARSGTVRPEARSDYAPADHAGIARDCAGRHSGCPGHRIDQDALARPHGDRRGPFGDAEALADQRYRDFRGAS